MRHPTQAYGYALCSLLLIATASLSSGEEKKPPPKPQVRDLGDGHYELGGIHFYQDSREIVFPGTVNLDQELLEYAIVNEKGSIHEALLRTTIRPFDLQVVLLLLRYQPYKKSLFEGFDRDAANPGAPTFDHSTAPQASRASISVRWEEDGEKKEASLASWIQDINSGSPMQEGFWLFNGLPDPTAMRHWKPEHSSNMVGIFLDEFSPLNYPYEGARNDENWTPNAKVMPPVETPVEIIIRPFTKEKTAR